jgi:hypothetical protein
LIGDLFLMNFSAFHSDWIKSSGHSRWSQTARTLLSSILSLIYRKIHEKQSILLVGHVPGLTHIFTHTIRSKGL